MKLKLVIAILILGNIALGIGVLRLQKQLELARTADPPTAAPAADPTPDAAPPTGQRALPASNVTAVTNTLVKTFNWEAVESADYREYIENLRAVGCPEETIRDIIIADVNKLYEQKKKAVRGEPKKFEYWKAGNPMMAMMGGGEHAEELRALDEEKLAVLRALGIEPDFRTQVAGMVDPMSTMFSFLPDEKQGRVLKIMTDMQQEMAGAFEDGVQPDMEVMAKAQTAMEDAIKAILTPEEFLDYQLRMSNTANMLRSHIAGFDPSEEEFLAVFKLREEFDQEFNPLLQMNQTDEERRKREAAQNELNNKIKQELGEERYAAYERAQDYQYQQMYQAAKRADLGVEAANQIYAMKGTAEEEAGRLRNNDSFTPEQRNAALQAMRAETEAAVREVLGDEGWKRYENQAWWLNTIAPERPRDPTEFE